jgi:hypothetical protein
MCGGLPRALGRGQQTGVMEVVDQRVLEAGALAEQDRGAHRHPVVVGLGEDPDVARLDGHVKDDLDLYTAGSCEGNSQRSAVRTRRMDGGVTLVC